MQLFGLEIKKSSPKAAITPDVAQKSLSINPIDIERNRAEMVEDILNRTISWMRLNNNEEYIKAWESISDLRTITTKLTSYFLRAPLRHYKIKPSGKKEIENSDIIRLFDNPNPLQSYSEFMSQMYMFLKITGNSYIFTDQTPGFPPSYAKILFNLNPCLLKTDIVKNEYYYEEKEISKLINKYLYSSGGNKAKQIDIDNVLHLNDVNLSYSGTAQRNYIEGASRLQALKYQITNIGVAYEAKNVLLSRRGALGIFTQAPSGAQAGFPLTDAEKESLQEQYSNYGLSRDQWQVIFTRVSLVWQQIAMNTADLQLYQGLEDDRKMLCAAYSLPYLLFATGGGEGSTFANLDIASQQIYKEAIIPDWISIGKALTKYFQLEDKKEVLEFDYSEIDVLQGDKTKEIDRKQKESQALSDLLMKYNTGQISTEQTEGILNYVFNYDKTLISELMKKEDVQEQVTDTISGQEQSGDL
jgi:hypothetical protein